MNTITILTIMYLSFIAAVLVAMLGMAGLHLIGWVLNKIATYSVEENTPTIYTYTLEDITKAMEDEYQVPPVPLGFNSWEEYDADWTATQDEIDLQDSIAAYEEEMDLEWEDEIMGYTLSDIVEFMVLDSEDDPYEHMPFQASMRRSAKTNKRGINVVLNCGEERSVHHYNAKDRK